MLKTLDPLLNADLLWTLRSMGHGNDLLLVDANFQADAVARRTVSGKLIRLDGVGAARAAQAILSVLPLDTYVEFPVRRIEVRGKPDEVPPVQQEVRAAVEAAEGRAVPFGSHERAVFYEEAKKAYAVVVAGGEGRPYGCFLLKKGVIFFQ